MAEMQTFLVLLKEKGGGGNEEAREVAKVPLPRSSNFPPSRDHPIFLMI